MKNYATRPGHLKRQSRCGARTRAGAPCQRPAIRGRKKSKARSPFRWPAPTRRPYPFWHFELDRFKVALEGGGSRKGFLETFVTAISPGMISVVNLRADDNPFYSSDREYLFDLAREMKKEYELIVSRIVSQ